MERREPTTQPAGNPATQPERIETPADRARIDGEDELSIHRWTDAELKQRAKDLGIEVDDSLTRAELIERVEQAQ